MKIKNKINKIGGTLKIWDRRPAGTQQHVSVKQEIPKRDSDVRQLELLPYEDRLRAAGSQERRLTSPKAERGGKVLHSARVLC